MRRSNKRHVPPVAGSPIEEEESRPMPDDTKPWTEEEERELRADVEAHWDTHDDDIRSAFATLDAERAKVTALHVAYRKRGAMLERSIAMLRQSHKDLCDAQMAFGGYAGHGSNLISGATADIGKFLESLDAKEPTDE